MEYWGGEFPVTLHGVQPVGSKGTSMLVSVRFNKCTALMQGIGHKKEMGKREGMYWNAALSTQLF